MNAIGAIGSVAMQAALSGVSRTAAASPGVASGGGGTVPAAQVAQDYSIGILAKVTHASADQALALIQAMSVPVSPLR